jgi:hypothetical protein
MGINRGSGAGVVPLAVLVAIAGGLVAGCASSQPAASVRAQQTETGSTRCGPQTGATIVRVSSMTEKSGEYWIEGVVQKAQCGPDVPDDVAFVDDGSAKSFEASAGVKYKMAAQDPARGYVTMSAATFAKAVDTKTGADGGLWYGGICEFDFDAAGHLTAVTEDYTP